MGVEDDKAALRRTMRKHRRGLEGLIPAAELIVDIYREAKLPTRGVVAVYARQGAELDALPLAHHLSQQGMQIAVPLVVAPNAPLGFQAVDLLNPKAPSPLSAAPGAPSVTPDLIITPLIAFDRRGYRLGQGGGFYDRTLAARRKLTPAPCAIGLAYAGQQVDRVPTDSYDQRLDGVLTEAEFIDLSGAC